MTQIRPGALIAIIVFAVFAAYAYLAPATYRTSALLVVESAGAGPPANMFQPLEAGRRLGEAILDAKTLASLSAERAGSSAPEARAQAASLVRHALEIDTSDGHTFSIGYRDQDPARTANACNLLAKRAAEVAPQVLVDRTAERAADLKRQQQTQELAAFLALHPQVAAEAPPAPDKSPDQDPALSAFHAEKANLDKRILEIESGIVSDNPYVDAKDSDIALLRRRQAEIETAVTARRAALEAKPTDSTLSPELRAEWKRLLDAMSASSADAQAQVHPAVQAHVTAVAAEPSTPLDPNRHLILFLGAVFGVGLGTAFALASRAAQQRRSKSSRPPAKGMQPAPPPAAQAAPQAPAQALLQPRPPPAAVPEMRLPVAPALPSGLGPSVPVTQPQRSSAPPIVPIPQRPISSSPPGPSPEQAEVVKHGSSRPPARRFASTLVLPPTENPTPTDELSADPLLASANTVWEQQIRAHEVPGFAVVKAGSEPPPRTSPTGSPAPFTTKPVSSAPPPAATIHRTTSRPPNQMKVTQPLGSFLPDNAWANPANGARPTGIPSPIPPPRSPSPAPPPPSASQYSYVSTSPPSNSSIPISTRPSAIRVREVQSDWRPDPTLTPQAQRALCESLYPYAVENCFVMAVISVPESVNYKSRVAAELALMLAESGHPRILLLEGDFQRPWVQRTMRVDMPIATGFSQQLNGRTQGRQPEPWSVLGCSKSLHVLAEGMMRTPGLMLSRHFSDCIRELRGYYDFVVIDGPTSSLDVDAGALDAITDGIVTVCPARGSANLAHLQTLFAQKRFSAFATAPG